MHHILWKETRSYVSTKIFFMILGIRTGGLEDFSELVKLIQNVNILGKNSLNPEWEGSQYCRFYNFWLCHRYTGCCRENVYRLIMAEYVLFKLYRLYQKKFLGNMIRCELRPWKIIWPIRYTAVDLDVQGLYCAIDTIYQVQVDLMNFQSALLEPLEKIGTNNLVELAHKRLKRRSRKVGSIPNDASQMRPSV